MILGTDLSRWNIVNDYSTLYNCGIRFGFTRASRGSTGDSRHYEHAKGLASVGIMWGPYHYMTSLTPVDIQLTTFARCAAPGNDLPPVLDVELVSIKEDDVYKFLCEIEESFGRTPILYTRQNVWDEVVKFVPSDKFRRFPLWVASYPYALLQPPLTCKCNIIARVEQSTIKFPRLPCSWDDYHFWQFTENADGMSFGTSSASRELDLNVWNGDYDELVAFAQGSSPPPPPPPTIYPDIPELPKFRVTAKGLNRRQWPDVTDNKMVGDPWYKDEIVFVSEYYPPINVWKYGDTLWALCHIGKDDMGWSAIHYRRPDGSYHTFMELVEE